MKPTITISQNQIDFFHREGYLAMDAITTQEEVQKLRAIYDRLFEQQAGREEGKQFDLAGTDEEGKKASLPQIMNPSKYAPELLDTLFRANAHAITAQILGESATLSFEHAILKPGTSGAPTPWHQDEAYWNPALEYSGLSVWMPLQEATLANGCMQFIPKSHKLEVVPHHSINHDPRIVGLEVDAQYLGESKAVTCPLPAGGATLHASRTFHYTSANRTNQPRRAYILVFRTPTKERSVPRDFYWMKGKQTAAAERAKQATTKL